MKRSSNSPAEGLKATSITARANAGEHCRKALAFCEELGLTPVPPIYELFYTYFEGMREDIVEGLDAAVARGETEQHHLLELHQTCMSGGDLAVAFDEIGTSLGIELGSLERIATTGQEGAVRSRRELGHLVSGMRNPPNQQEVSVFAQRMRNIVLEQSRNVAEMKEGLEDARTRLGRIEKELETYVRAANTDFLTGLPNRRALDAKLAGLFAGPLPQDAFDCLLIIDIDWFKLVNDTHGHEVGDNVLREFASILRSECERVGAYTGRWGGEEFCVIQQGGSGNRGFELAEAIRQRFEGLNWKRMSDGADIGKITVSVGHALRGEESDAASLIRDADKSLYAAKDEGRYRCRRFTDL
jgi:diguanylate cyclase